MANQIIPLGRPTNYTTQAFLSWDLVPTKIHGDFVIDGKEATIQRFAIHRGFLQLLIIRGSTSIDLIDKWEQNDEALGLFAETILRVFPGPDSESSITRDISNPYLWRTGLEISFLTWYDSLNSNQRNNFSLQLNSGTPAIFRKADVGKYELSEKISRKHSPGLIEPIQRVWRKMAPGVYELVFEDQEIISARAEDELALSGEKFILDDPTFRAEDQLLLSGQDFILDDPLYKAVDILDLDGTPFKLDDNLFRAQDILKLSGSSFKLDDFEYRIQDVLKLSGGNFQLDDLEYETQDILKLSGSRFRLPDILIYPVNEILALSGTEFKLDDLTYPISDVLELSGTDFDLPAHAIPPPKVPQNFTATLEEVVTNPPGQPVATATATDNSITVNIRQGSGGVPTSYRTEIDTNNRFTNPIIRTGSATSQVFNNLANDTYYVRVRASNSDGISAWSTIVSAIVNYIPPPTSVPSIPVINISVVGSFVTITWRAVDTATSYRVEIHFRAGSLWIRISNIITTRTRWAGTYSTGRYRARISAINSAGSSGGREEEFNVS